MKRYTVRAGLVSLGYWSHWVSAYAVARMHTRTTGEPTSVYRVDGGWIFVGLAIFERDEDGAVVRLV